MTLKTLGTGYGGTGLTDVPAAVKQLQGLKQVIVDGAAANANIAVTGLLATAHIVGIQNLTDLATVAEAATVAAGNIKLPTTNTTSKKLLVTYYV